MNFNITINNRDFSTRPLQPFNLQVDRLTWSAHGGCDRATLTAKVPADRLLEFSSLLRCPVTVTDPHSVPVWWGYIDKITFYFEKSYQSISLEDLYNQVKVKYSFHSPDNRIADQYETPYADHKLSMAEYGTKQVVLFQRDIDEEFALNLRDTFLKLSALPHSVISPTAPTDNPRIELSCSGWFHSLEWLFYENQHGFYANYGPGPGMLALGDNTSFNAAQRFYVAKSYQLAYMYFLVRKVGSPTVSTYARLLSDDPVILKPLSVISNAQSVPFSSYLNNSYQWVKFTFSSLPTLSASTYYWADFYPDSSLKDPNNHFSVRTDENATFNTTGELISLRLITDAWVNIPNITQPGLIPSLYFRVLCQSDTGSQLDEITTAGNQFFTNIRSLVTNVKSSPYRFNGLSCYAELIDLMDLGTGNQRRILADVDSGRRLRFYEQPDPSQPTVFLDQFGRYFTRTAQMIPAYRPPIGQWAMFSGSDRVVPPFETHRAPLHFVDRAEYSPKGSS